MKTALIVHSFLHGVDESGYPRVERLKKYLTYYRGIQEKLGINDIYVTDNGGSAEQIADVLSHDANLHIIRHPYLQRGHGHPIYDVLPNWRATYDYIIPIYAGFEKIIIMDDDAYVLSERLAAYIKSINTGWETFWCPKHNMPEATISILCKDAFSCYLDFIKTPFEQRNKTGQMELIIPYGPINKNFNIDRWSEYGRIQELGMDAFCQCYGNILVKFEQINEILP